MQPSWQRSDRQSRSDRIRPDITAILKPRQRRDAAPATLFSPAEHLMFPLILGLAAAALSLSLLRGLSLRWLDFAPRIAIFPGLIALAWAGCAAVASPCASAMR